MDKIRHKLNKIDRKIVKLVAKRVALIPAIAEYKKKNNLPVHDSKREKEIFEEKRKLASDLNVNPDLVKDIFKRLIEESYNIEELIIKEKK
tara:strand:- start:89 stop:361 length:273 start_codon:yes stop_codon:yes gene_type:complete